MLTFYSLVYLCIYLYILQVNSITIILDQRKFVDPCLRIINLNLYQAHKMFKMIKLTIKCYWITFKRLNLT